MHSWQGGRGIWTMMTMATTTSNTTMVNNYNDKDPNCEDNEDPIFDTTTNLWSDAFLAKRVDSDKDNDEDLNGKDNDDLIF